MWKVLSEVVALIPHWFVRCLQKPVCKCQPFLLHNKLIKEIFLQVFFLYSYFFSFTLFHTANSLMTVNQIVASEIHSSVSHWIMRLNFKKTFHFLRLLHFKIEQTLLLTDYFCTSLKLALSLVSLYDSWGKRAWYIFFYIFKK